MHQKKKINVFKTAAFMCFFVAAALLVSAIYKTNKMYPPAQKTDIKQGEALMIGDIEVSITAVQKTSVADFFKAYASTELDLKMYSAVCPLEDQRLFTYKISLHNTSNEEQTFPLYSFLLSNLIWANGIDMNMFLTINENGTLSPTIAAYNEITLALPFIMYRPQYSKQNWANAESQVFWLTYSAYPDYIRFII